jgi:hypothetical protein
VKVGNLLRKTESESESENKPGIKMALYFTIYIKHSLSAKANGHTQYRIFHVHVSAGHTKGICPELVLLVFLTCLKMFRDCHSQISNFSLSLGASNIFNFVVFIHPLLT